MARSHAISHWPKIIDALPMRIILCDRQGRIRLLNAMSRNHLDDLARGSGRIGADYLGLMLEHISSSCLREAFGTSFRLLINGGAGFRHPVQATTRSGDISFTVTGSAIPGEEELFIICHLPVQEEETSLPQGMIRECMFMAEDAERRRIARELHDETAQQLALIRVNLSKFINSGEADEADPDLVEADCAVSQVQHQIRTLTYALHPPGLSEGGIVMALQCFCREMSRRTGLEVRFQNLAGAVGRSPAMESAFFRIAQEGLNNVLKHARATRVLIALKREQERLVLEVEDDGIGVPEQVARGVRAGVGLPGIRERLDALAGDLRIGRAERGTRLVAAIPWQRAAAASAATAR